MSMDPFERRAARRVGTTLGGKYRIERVIGVGGMATVYQAVHRNGHRVAIKMLHDELSHRDDVRVRFLREGYVANLIGHPGAVRIADDDVAEDGSAFLVLELLAGETLRARLERSGGRLPCREVLALGHQLTDVLGAAHAAGIIHRDIKPENLFLTTARALKVLDFGIARIEDDPGGLATATGMRLGTPAFMPPELALGRTAEIDARTDLWSAGATLFQLLSGELVHAGSGAAEMVVRAATVPPRSLATVAPEVPASVVALVDRALAFARDDRWPSARAMQQAIEEAHAALFGEAISPAAIGPVNATHAAENEGSAVKGSPWPEEPAPARPRAAPDAETMAAPLSAGSGALAPGTLASPAPAVMVRDGSADGGIVRDGSGDVDSKNVGNENVVKPDGNVGRSDPGAVRSTAQAESSTPARSAPPPSTPSSAPPAPLESAASASPPVAPPRWKTAVAAVLTIALASGAAWLFARRGGGDPSGSAITTTAMPTTIATVSPPGCADNRACIAASGGRPSLCRKDDGVCVALESEDCRVLAEPGDAANDATVWVGAMWPVGEPDPLHYGPRSGNAIELARRDFVETSGGLPPARPGGPKRPIGVVLCDDRAKPERAADHLVNELRVPAVLGFRTSKELLDLASSHFLPKGVLAIAATGSAAALRNIPLAPGPLRLVWRVTVATDQATQPFAAVVEHVFEPELRAAAGVLRPGEPIRVAQLRQQSLAGQSTVDSRMTALRWNGKSVAENGDAFRQIARADAYVASDPTAVAENERTARDVAAFLPHVVLDLPPNPALLEAIERRWPPGAPFRPRYLTEGTWVDLGPSLDWKRGNLHRRLFSLDSPSSGDAIVRFALRYNELYSPRVTPATAPGAPYDAFYLFAYAAAAVGEQPLTGAALSRALSRLMPPGEPIGVGPGNIYPAFLALSAGRKLDLGGAASSLDLDPATGDTGVDFALYCLSPATAKAPAHQLESGLVWDSRARALTGSLHCP